MVNANACGLRRVLASRHYSEVEDSSTVLGDHLCKRVAGPVETSSVQRKDARSTIA